MLILVLAGQLISSRPPLSPEEAVAVLRSSHSVADRTALPMPTVTPSSYDWSLDPRGVYVLNSSPGEGPFGPFPAYPAPINTPNWSTTFYVGPNFYERHRRGGYDQGYERSLRYPVVGPIPPPQPPRNTVGTATTTGRRVRQNR